MKIGSCELGARTLDIYAEYDNVYCKLRLDIGGMTSKSYPFLDMGLAIKTIINEFGNDARFTWYPDKFDSLFYEIKIGSCDIDGKLIDVYIGYENGDCKLRLDIGDLCSEAYQSLGHALKAIIKKLGNDMNFTWDLEGLNSLKSEEGR